MSDTPAGPLMTDTAKLIQEARGRVELIGEYGDEWLAPEYVADLLRRLASALEAKQADTERLEAALYRSRGMWSSPSDSISVPGND